jgi:hypothetical protein
MLPMHHNQPAESEVEPLRGNLTADQQRRIDHLVAWCQASGTSEAALCKASHTQQPLWSSLKKGNYPASTTEKHLQKLERGQATLLTARKEAAHVSTELLDTPTWAKLRDSVETSLGLAARGSEHKLTLFIAPSRHGKTTSSKRLVTLYTGLAVNARTYWRGSKRALLEDLCKLLKLSHPARASQAKLTELIHRHFATPKLLILNELGPSTVSPWMVAWLRELLNETKVVLVMCGVPELLGYLASRMKDELEQLELRGRIVRWEPIDSAQVQWFFHRAGRTLDEPTAQALAEQANDYGGYSFVETVAALKSAPTTPDAARAVAQAFRTMRHIEAQPRRRQAA